MIRKCCGLPKYSGRSITCAIYAVRKRLYGVTKWKSLSKPKIPHQRVVPACMQLLTMPIVLFQTIITHAQKPLLMLIVVTSRKEQPFHMNF